MLDGTKLIGRVRPGGRGCAPNLVQVANPPHPEAGKFFLGGGKPTSTLHSNKKKKREQKSMENGKHKNYRVFHIIRPTLCEVL